MDVKHHVYLLTYSRLLQTRTQNSVVSLICFVSLFTFASESRPGSW